MKSPRYGFTLVIDPHSALTLQHQVRQRLVDAMAHGILRPGRRLPSSRMLARQAGISRNTVTLAYDALLAEGHLQSRPRSGIFVAPDAQLERVATGRRGLRRPVRGRPAAEPAHDEPGFRVPPNWLDYPYPFLDGCIEPELVPVEGWRESLQLACSRQDLLRWGTSAGGSEDARFVDELRTKVFPAWGIDAGPDEVIATVSAQQALFLVLGALVERGTPVVFDAGIDVQLQGLVLARGAILHALQWEGSSARLCAPLPRGAVVLVGSRRSTPGTIRTADRAGALLEAAAASGATIVDCVHAAGLPEAVHDAALLRSLDRHGLVVSVGALAPVAALGGAPGIVHAQARLVARMRNLRRDMGADFPVGLQRAWSYFLALGHYSRSIARADVRLAERRTALRDALNHYLHRFVRIEARAGSSAYWVGGGPQWNSEGLARAAANVGVLIEPVPASTEAAQFCMGITSIKAERIRAGVQELARIIRADPRLGSRRLQDEGLAPLAGNALKRALSGATLLYNTVYGEPCTLTLSADGSLSGRAGYSNEDRDTGRWWVEGGLWFRQWHHWAYGEAMGLQTVIDGEQVRWFNTDGLLIDTALVVRRRRARA
jgi:GntR family transcriptional regulator/MocR family aminotransferase